MKNSRYSSFFQLDSLSRRDLLYREFFYRLQVVISQGSNYDAWAESHSDLLNKRNAGRLAMDELGLSREGSEASNLASSFEKHDYAAVKLNSLWEQFKTLAYDQEIQTEFDRLDEAMTKASA